MASRRDDVELECPDCGESPCECDEDEDALFDADELGLDPEDDDNEGRD